MPVNVPVTVYRDTSGLTEFSSESPNDIVDTLGNDLVDPSGNQIVDTGVIATLIPATAWTEDDSV
jgi:hypothetical protein